MQSLARAVSSLRGTTCSTSGRFAARAFSDAAGGIVEEGVTEEVKEGAKTTLHRLLETAEKPLTSAEVWALAENEGLKSKRFMKQMLQQMRKRGHVKTSPLGGGKKHKAFGYLLPNSAAANAQTTHHGP